MRYIARAIAEQNGSESDLLSPRRDSEISLDSPFLFCEIGHAGEDEYAGFDVFAKTEHLLLLYTQNVFFRGVSLCLLAVNLSFYKVSNSVFEGYSDKGSIEQQTAG